MVVVANDSEGIPRSAQSLGAEMSDSKVQIFRLMELSLEWNAKARSHSFSTGERPIWVQGETLHEAVICINLRCCPQ